MRNSYVTVTDQFCGAGGSSQGAVAAGAELKMALNHWRLAIETHNSNFPDADHDCTDISACDPRRYPGTDILITSPECTNHSLAKGKARTYQRQMELFGKVEIDPAEERSRATMWDVVRFSEYHNYRVVIVENVVEARHWPPFDAWTHAMALLGYEHECVYFNSMFAYPTPQSRDRMYVIFWKKGNRKPDLRFCPPAWCQHCGKNVEAVQSWKKPLQRWGKYQTQYVYRCPECAELVQPYYYCAANAIDWSLPAPRIGDRARPLKEKTLKRIKIGLEKFRCEPQLVDIVHSGNDRDMVKPATAPWRTQIGQNTQAFVVPPFLVDLAYSHGHDRRSTSSESTWPTQTGQQTLGLAVPPFLVSNNYFRPSKPIDAPYPTQTSGNQYGVVVPPYLLEMRNGSTVGGIDEPVSTVTAHAVNHGLLVPPFVTSYYGQDTGHELSDALPTVPTRDRHGLVLPPFLVSYYTRLSGQQAAVCGMDEAVPTVPGWAVHYLAQPGETPSVDDCGFRMLQPHEIGRAMAFPDSYIVLGTQREKVKQLGNAVTPPVMQMLLERCLATLG